MYEDLCRFDKIIHNSEFDGVNQVAAKNNWH